MLAGNHEKIYDRWASVLEAGLIRTGSSADPYSVYLGNWMADMSQVYDPAVAQKIVDTLAAPGQLLATILDFVTDNLWKLDTLAAVARPIASEVDMAALDAAIDGVRRSTKELNDGLDIQATTLSGVEAFDGALELILPTVRLLCLMHFSAQAHEPKRIPPTVVYDLFAEHFGTYKPYQHLDRALAADLVGRARQGDIEKDYANYVHVTPGPETIGMKGYLHQAVTVALSFLNTLSLRRPLKLTNSDAVKLGFTLHVIEDYFAHSNFLERLIICNPDTQSDWVKGFEAGELAKLVTSNTAIDGLSQPDRARPAFDFVSLPDGFAGPFEPQVVTGFFGSDDIWHSLFHVAAEKVAAIWELKEAGPDEPPILLDTLELLLVAKPLAALDEIAVANAVYKKPPSFKEALMRRMRDPEVRRHAERIGLPSQMLTETGEDFGRALAKLVHAMSKGGPPTVGEQRLRLLLRALRAVLSLMRQLQAIRKALDPIMREVKQPLVWLRQTAPVKAAFERGAAASAKGMTRLEKAFLTEPPIGSHSAIAKDERLGQNILYQKAEDFAVGLDTFILSKLFETLEESSNGSADPAEAPASKVPRLIRWDETLMGLLKDPIQIYGDAAHAPVELMHVDVVPVTPTTMTGVIERGYGMSGFQDFDAYISELGTLNPEIECTGATFQFREGSMSTSVALPLAVGRPVQGFLCSSPVVEVSNNWRKDLYFEGTANLKPFLVYGSPEEVKAAVRASRDTRDFLLDDFKAVLVCLFPSMEQSTIRWGYCGP